MYDDCPQSSPDVGSHDGRLVGSMDGVALGSMEGVDVGKPLVDGKPDGVVVGLEDGMPLGKDVPVGNRDGLALGPFDGDWLGSAVVGAPELTRDGLVDGKAEGCTVGWSLSACGDNVGTADGDPVG